MNYSLFLTFLTFVLCTYCTFTIGKTVSLDTGPSGASISIVSSNGEGKKAIGKTPYKTTMEELLKYTDRPFFMVEFLKEGFAPYRILFSKVNNVDLEFTVKLTADNKAESVKKYDNMINRLFSAQRLIRGADYNGAIDSLTVLEKEFDDFSIVSELKAMAFYLNKKPSQALTFYRKAFSKNTDNVDAYKMKTYLEKKMNLEAK